MIDQFDIENQKNDSIKSMEVRNLISKLQDRYGTSLFIDTVSYELQEFAKRIDEKSNLKEENDLLSPKQLMDQSFYEFRKTLESKKKSYFHLAEEQLYNATHFTAEIIEKESAQKVKSR